MNRSFIAVVFAQCQVLFNGYASKLVVMTMGIQILALLEASGQHGFLTEHNIKNVLAALMILPFVLLAPTVGWLADRFSKRDILLYAQCVQTAIMALMCFSLWTHHLDLAILCIFLLGIQSATFSASKLGIMKELVDSKSLSTAASMFEATAIASILVGGLIGGVGYTWWLSHLPNSSSAETAWLAALYCALPLAGFAVLGIIFMCFVRATPVQGEGSGPFRIELLWEHFGQLKSIWPQRSVRLCMLGYSYFYGIATALTLTLIETAQMVAGDVGMAQLSGVYQATLGLGIVCGSILVGILAGRRIELGLVPIGAMGIIAGLITLGFVQPEFHSHTQVVVDGVEKIVPVAHSFGNPLFFVPLFGLGVFGAMFVVPLNAYMQEHARPGERGRVMSASGLVLNMTTILAILTQGLITAYGVPTRWQYVLFALPTLCVATYVMILLPENFIRFTIGLFARFIYRIRPVRDDKFPEKGGVLLLSNHLSIRDAILLQISCPRTIRFVIFDPVVQGRLLNLLMRVMRCIPISPGKAKSAVDAALDALKDGEVVCLFPEHSLKRASALQELNGLLDLLARKSQAPLVPVWLENTWSEAARTTNTVVNVYYGEPMEADTPLMEVRARLYDLGEEAFSARPELKSHMGAEVLKGLKGKFFKPVVVDTFKGESITGGKLLAASLGLAAWLKVNVKEKRVGIILPPGIGATIANVACVFADKTSVNLNFTLDRASNETCLRKSGVKTIISAPALWDKLTDFPWPANRIDMAATMKSLPPSGLKLWFIFALCFPAALVRVIAGIPRLGGRDEASLLFTSGSSGEPKGVMLSHRNILANTMQIQSMLADVHVGTVLGCLPIFHSYGSTVTLWWPMLSGPQVVTHVSPRETGKLIEIIAEHKIHLLITTPTFLRHYIRKAKPEQLASLKMVVTGAEKLPLEVASEFEKAVHLPVCEGYGMTEATPVVGVNLLDDPPCPTRPEGVQNRTVGSVGRIVPGLSVRIRHPDTDADLPISQSGILWLKGANVFEGYLDDPDRTADVLKDGWYRTGDVGRMDDKGFLYVEGRISRFSKIGGEMVPHGTVEGKIEELFGLTDHDAPIVVVMGVPDEAKGESLVILSTKPLEISEIRSRLSAAGFPNLWIPRVIYLVETMPVMATGKLNLAECQRVALELTQGKRQSAVSSSSIAHSEK